MVWKDTTYWTMTLSDTLAAVAAVAAEAAASIKILIK